jgi:DNA-binding transcriptional LysR family regulator
MPAENVHIELRHLRCFLTVAELRHFGKAAARLHIAQPGLSQQIQRMERLLGTTLFQRTTHGAELTPAGRALLPEARAVLERCERAVEAARQVARRGTRPIRIGLSFVAGGADVLAAVRTFRQVSPAVEIRMIDVPPADRFRALHDDLVNVLFQYEPLADPSVRSEPVRDEPISALLPADHPLADRACLDMAELADERWTHLPVRSCPEYREALVSLARRYGFEPRVEHEWSSLPELLTQVAGCSCVTLAAESSLGGGGGGGGGGGVVRAMPGIAVVPVKDISAPLSVTWSEPALAPEAVGFIEVVRAVVAAR